SEIEELQKEMAPVKQAQPAQNDASLEDTLASLKEEEATGGVLAAVMAKEEAHHEAVQGAIQEAIHEPIHESHEKETMSHGNSNSEGSLSLNLTGNMTLKLK